MKFRKIVWPPHPLIYVEPCSHLIDVISQARMIPIEVGIDLKLVMQGTNDVLILLEQVLKILVVLTSSWHVRWRHMLLRLLDLGLIFIVPEIHIFIFGVGLFPEDYFIHWPRPSRIFFKCGRI